MNLTKLILILFFISTLQCLNAHVFEFSSNSNLLEVAKKYQFIGHVEKGKSYIIRVTRVEESNERSNLLLNHDQKADSRLEKVKYSSELIQAANPFVAHRKFTAPETGTIIYEMSFISSEQFLNEYPTLESFQHACESKKITRGGEKISEQYEQEREYLQGTNLPVEVTTTVELINWL